MFLLRNPRVIKLFSVFALACLFLLSLSCFPPNHESQTFKQPVDSYIRLKNTTLAVSVVASKLKVPWDMAWGPDNQLWITEQEGIISRIDPVTGKKKVLVKLTDVWLMRTAGLLGMALSKDMKKNPFVYVDYTSIKGKIITSKLVRFEYKNDSLVSPKLLLEIPGGTGHNGSRIVISAQEKLIWATGDLHDNKNAQDTTSVNGKILRLNLDGTFPADNPIKNSPVWAWGFRNMQGLTFDGRGNLYTSEHGDAIEDEVNRIVKRGNYGWSTIEGKHNLPEEKAFAHKFNTIEPLISWTPVIAPSGMAYYGGKLIPEWNNSLLLVTLKGKSLRVLKLNELGDKVANETICLENKYGRMRAICVSPVGDVYISTSNRDWNPAGVPHKDDDRILRITKSNVQLKTPVVAKIAKNPVVIHQGLTLYKTYCASCHKDNGMGVKSIFPSLKGSKAVTGSKSQLIDITLKGIKSSSDLQMPAFNFLKDEQCAAILSYIRTNWGNKGSVVSKNDIAMQRKKK